MSNVRQRVDVCMLCGGWVVLCCASWERRRQDRNHLKSAPRAANIIHQLLVRLGRKRREEVTADTTKAIFNTMRRETRTKDELEDNLLQRRPTPRRTLRLTGGRGGDKRKPTTIASFMRTGPPRS